MAIAKGFGCLRRIGFDDKNASECGSLHSAACAPPANLAKRLTKINLCVAWRVRQRHEHLPRPPPLSGHNRDPAGEAMFIAQTLIYPPRCVPLLRFCPIWLMIGMNGSSFGRTGGCLAVRPQTSGSSTQSGLCRNDRPPPAHSSHRHDTRRTRLYSSTEYISPPSARLLQAQNGHSATVRLFDRFCGPVLLRDSHTQ